MDMKKEHLIRALQQYNHWDLIEEAYGKHNLSTDEQILFEGKFIPYSQKMTIEEFAKTFEGNNLIITYKDNQQTGFLRIGSTKQHKTYPFRTLQNIEFNIEHPENGTLSFDLNEYRNKS